MPWVKIDLRNRQRQRLGRVEVDVKSPPPVVRVSSAAGGGVVAVDPAHPAEPADRQREIYLDWDGAFDDHKHLRRCPACGCRELFVRRDFPQVTGFVIVLFAAVAAMILFGARQVVLAVAVLVAVALIDAVIFFFAGKCLVCYRCRSEFRDTPIRPDHPGWELATGEKYRQAGMGSDHERDQS
jgi:hypothetical protein